MNDILMWLIGGGGYVTMSGFTFRVMANRSEHPDDPWKTPGPLFSALGWPAVFPLLLGNALAGDPGGKAQKKRLTRDEELAEAKHRKELARVEAETLQIKERSALN